MSTAHIAIDLGAESGRVVIIALDQNQYTLHEIHRFPNGTIELPSGLHWNVAGLWREITSGLILAARWSSENGITISSVGVDTWGVDWALLGQSGELIGLPHAYRDPRNQEAFEKATSTVSVAEIYQETGIQIMAINSLFSVYAQCLTGPELIKAAAQLVFMPDLFHFWLSGVSTVEKTIASTSQIVNVRNGQWSQQLLSKLEIPAGLFSECETPGTPIGTIRPSLARQTGLPESVQVVLPASHDTASAVAAVPTSSSNNWCFLSSGTWSLLGAEISEPCTSLQAQSAMFTNESGVNDTVRFLKNIAGLWLIQQCRREFELRDQTYDYGELTELARLAEPFRTLIDPDYGPFQTAGNMLEKIQRFADDTQQPHPETPGDYLRCCLESLAMAYRQTLDKLQEVLQREFDVIHIVGGGGQNELLNQMTANATEKRVVVGPYEATAAGNGLVQAMGLGHIKDLKELRGVVGRSVEIQEFTPDDTQAWRLALERFLELPGR